MNRPASPQTTRPQPKGQPSVSNYYARVGTYIDDHRQQRQHVCTALLFSCKRIGTNDRGNLEYRFKTQNRLFLDSNDNPVLDPSKAQKFALTVAKINDDLLFEVDRESREVRVVNTEEIRAAWKVIKPELLASLSDLSEMIDDFEWQLREENIQAIFSRDNFYQFFFSNIFYPDMEEGAPEDQKTIANGLGNLDIPIIEKKWIPEQDSPSRNIGIGSKADIDIENERFPLEKLNLFLGNLGTPQGSDHKLKFKYDGAYSVRPNNGLLAEGRLEYRFKIKGLYEKTTTINLNLEEDER